MQQLSTYGGYSSDEISSRLLKMVSVMWHNADGSWPGGMLDGLVFVQAQQDQGSQPDGARVLLLGAGGPAVLLPSHCWNLASAN